MAYPRVGRTELVGLLGMIAALGSAPVGVAAEEPAFLVVGAVVLVLSLVPLLLRLYVRRSMKRRRRR